MITYFDTSAFLKLIVDDETGADAVEQLWVASTAVVCSELGYVEARAAIASARRAWRLSAAGGRLARESLDELWMQFEVVPVTGALVRQAADRAELDALRGFDAVHLAAALTAGADTFATSDEALRRAADAHGMHTARADGAG